MQSKRTSKKILSLLLTVVMVLAMLPATAFADDSPGTIDISGMTNVDEIQAAIVSALESTDTVTVAGYYSGATGKTLAVEIPSGKTVTWEANYQAGGSMTAPFLDLTGSGSFEVAEQAMIVASNSDIVAINADCDVIVNGGRISSRSETAIIGKKVTVTGGTVQSGDEYDPDAGSETAIIGENVAVSGGNVLAHLDSNAIEVTGVAQITITGGSVRGGLSGAEPTNGTEPVYLVTLGGMPSGKMITSMATPPNYGVKNVETDSYGKLYFYLPAGAASIVLTEYYGTIYNGSVDVTAAGPNAATMKPDNPVAEDFASLKAALEDTTATTSSKPILVTDDIIVTGEITVGAADHYLKFDKGDIIITAADGGSLVIPEDRELHLPSGGILKAAGGSVSISGKLDLMNNAVLDVQSSGGASVTIASTGELYCLNADVTVANTAGTGIDSQGDINIGFNSTLLVKNDGGSTGSTGIAGSVTVEGASSQLLVKNTGKNSTGISGSVTMKNSSAEIKNQSSETGAQNVGISGSSLSIENSSVSVKSVGTGDSIFGIMMESDSVTNIGEMKLIGSSLTIDTPHTGISAAPSGGITWNLDNNSGISLQQGRLDCTGAVLTVANGGKLTLAEDGIVTAMNGKIKDQNYLLAAADVTVGAEDAEPSTDGLSAGIYTWDVTAFSKAAGASPYDYEIDLAGIADSPVPAADGYSKSDTTITLNQTNKTYRIHGTTTVYNLVVEAVGAKVTLDGADIDIRKPTPADPFSLKAVLEIKTDTTLILKGDNTFQGDLSNMINGNDYTPSLTIQGNGSLKAGKAFTYFKELNLNLSGGSLEASALSAKTITIKNGNIQTGWIGADTLLDIQGGTTVTKAAANQRQMAPVSAPSVEISGGSFRLDYEPYTQQDQQALFGYGGHPSNSAGAAVYLVRLVNLPASAPAVVQTSGYGAKGIKTDSEGSLYLWLPAGSAAIHVEAGGEIYDLTPTIAADDSANTVSVQTVTHDAADAAELKAGLESGSPATINVTADIILSEEIVLGADHILNLPLGKKLTFTGATPAGSILIDSNRTLTIQGGGTMEITRKWDYALNGAGVLNLEGVKLSLRNEINGGMSVKTVNAGNGAEILIAGATTALVIPAEGVLNINSGGTVTADGYFSAAIQNSGTLNINGGGTLVLKTGSHTPALINEAAGALVCSGGIVAVDENAGVRLKQGSKVTGFAGKFSDRGQLLNTENEITVAAADQAPAAGQLTEALYTADSAGILTHLAIVITKQPEDITVTEGLISDSDQLSIECSIPGVTYQWWRKAGGSAVSVPGATGSVLPVPKNLKEGAYLYYCELSLAGSDNVQSSTVTVTVQFNPNPTPNADDITKVSITGVTAPVADAAPTLNGIALPEDAKYTIASSIWCYLDGKGDMQQWDQSKPFEIGATYIFYAVLAPNPGEYFADADKMTFTVNNKKAECLDLGAGMEDYRAVIYSFGELKATSIITAGAEANGTISPSGSVEVAKGESITFTITANPGYRISSVTVDGENKGAISTYTFSNVTEDHTVSAAFVSKGGSSGGGGSSTPATPPATSPLTPTGQKTEPPVTNPGAPARMTDTAGHWGKEAIDYVLSRGLFAGTSETTFSPNSLMTRAMVWTTLARLDGQNTAGGDSWYALARDWAKAKGISDGATPQGSVTREQLVVILYRYAGSPAVNRDLRGFADAGQISDWAADALQWSVENGLVLGSNNALNPAGNATRAEVSAILMRYIKLTSN